MMTYKLENPNNSQPPKNFDSLYSRYLLIHWHSFIAMSCVHFFISVLFIVLFCVHTFFIPVICVHFSIISSLFPVFSFISVLSLPILCPHFLSFSCHWHTLQCYHIHFPMQIILSGLCILITLSILFP